MTKKETIEALYRICQNRGDFVFDNTLVKEVMHNDNSIGNPYDITKVDDVSKLPECLVNEGYTIIHIGGGRHKFSKCLDKMYHVFESIDDTEIIDWHYRPSVLNDYSISESSILSLANNHRILHDFLYQDFSCAPKMYNSERKRGVTFEYMIANERAEFEDLQIEIDLTAENNGYVTVFEGKNTGPNSWLPNFNVYQLYNPFRYYYNLQQENRLAIRRLSACYLVKQKNDDNTKVRLYNYTFDNPLDMASITLLKKREYHLRKRALEDE
jgi:hypothetical protein